MTLALLLLFAALTLTLVALTAWRERGPVDVRIDELIAANRARSRPGMERPDSRLRAGR